MVTDRLRWRWPVMQVIGGLAVSGISGVGGGGCAMMAGYD